MYKKLRWKKIVINLYGIPRIIKLGFDNDLLKSFIIPLPLKLESCYDIMNKTKEHCVSVLIQSDGLKIWITGDASIYELED